MRRSRSGPAGPRPLPLGASPKRRGLRERAPALLVGPRHRRCRRPLRRPVRALLGEPLPPGARREGPGHLHVGDQLLVTSAENPYIRSQKTVQVPNPQAADATTGEDTAGSESDGGGQSTEDTVPFSTPPDLNTIKLRPNHVFSAVYLVQLRVLLMTTFARIAPTKNPSSRL